MELTGCLFDRCCHHFVKNDIQALISHYSSAGVKPTGKTGSVHAVAVTSCSLHNGFSKSASSFICVSLPALLKHTPLSGPVCLVSVTPCLYLTTGFLSRAMRMCASWKVTVV